jgi:hypothetical protein
LTYVENARFSDQLQRTKGTERVFGEPLFPPQWAVFTRDANEVPVWLYAGQDGIAFTDGTLHTDITPLDFISPVASNLWTGGVLNNIPVMSDRLPYYWGGVGLADVLPDWPLTRFCGALRPYKFHLIAMAINEGGTLLEDAVYWSSAAAPGQIPQEWTPAPDNEAGSTELSQTAGQVVDGAPLRSSFLIYKDTSTYVMDYVGGSNVMNVRPLFYQSGILARNCFAEWEGRHFVLTDGDVIVTDGQTIQSVADGKIRKALFATIDGANFRNCFATVNYANSEIWFCVPEAGESYPSVAYTFDVRSGNWGRRTLGEKPAYMAMGQVRLVPEGISWDEQTKVWDDDSSAWDSGGQRVDYYALASVSPGENSFFAVDADSTFYDGQPVEVTIQRNALDFGDNQIVKTVKAVWLEVEGTPGSEIQVSLGGTSTPDASPVFGAPVVYTIGGENKLSMFATGRYIAYRITAADSKAVEPWRISRLEFEYDVRGVY